MADRDQWNRRRFLALAGGTTMLAGCAAEPTEEEEPETSSEDDENEESNDTGEEQGDNSSGNESATNGNESASNEGNSTESDTEEELGNESEEGDGVEDSTEASENSSTEEETPTEEETSTEEETETSTEEQTETPTEEETATEEEEDTPSEPPLSDISIRVVGSAGEPIEGATVTGEGDPHEADIALEFDGETNSDGVHENRIYENEYSIEVNHPDYEATTVEHTHDGESELEVELETVVETFPITIRVNDSEGESIGGASVLGQGEPHEANIPLEFSGETDSNGEYNDVIYENEYTIEVDHPDYGSETTRVTHEEGETEIEVSLESDGTHQLTVVGVDEDGEPVEDALVEIGDRIDGVEGQTGRTDENGRITFQIESGEYKVGAMKNLDHTPYLADEYIGTVTVENDTTIEQEVAYLRYCNVTVSVVNPKGDPIENAIVDGEAQPEEIWEYEVFSSRTNANGEVNIERWCGSWQFRVAAEGYERIIENRQIENDGKEEFVLEPDSDEETEMLTFEIVDAETGEPVEDAEVSAHQQSDESEEISGTTAEKGIIHFKQPAATWEVSVEAEGYAPESFTVEHDTDEPTETVVELDPEGV